MAEFPVSRRSFGGAIAVGMVALAGCSDDLDDTDDDGNSSDDPADGEPSMDDGDDEETPTSDPGDQDDDEAADDEEETDGMVRVVHGSPDAPNVDVYADDGLVVENVAFRAVSDYLTRIQGGSPRL